MCERKITDLPQDCLVEILSHVPNSCTSWAPAQMNVSHPPPVANGTIFARCNPTTAKFCLSLVCKVFARAVNDRRAWKRGTFNLYIRRCKLETRMLINCVSFDADRSLNAIQHLCSVMRVSLMAINLNRNSQTPSTSNHQSIDTSIIHYLSDLYCPELDLFVNDSCQMVDYSRLIQAHADHLRSFHLRMEVTQDDTVNDDINESLIVSAPAQLTAEHCDLLGEAIGACTVLSDLHLHDFDTDCTDQLIEAFKHTQLSKLEVTGNQSHIWFIPKILNMTEGQAHLVTLILDRPTNTTGSAESVLSELHAQVLHRLIHLQWSDNLHPDWILQNLPNLLKTNPQLQCVQIGRVLPDLSLDDVLDLLHALTENKGRELNLSLPYSPVANDWLCPLNELANQNGSEAKGLFQWVTKRGHNRKQAVLKYNNCNINVELKYV